jgi:hypothetical protein
MREARIKVDPDRGEAVYHCISKTVNGEKLFDDTCKEVFRRQLWLLAEFCGLQIVTYAIVTNHFHILVRVPFRTPVPDQELLRRYGLLYPKPTKYRAAQLAVIRSQLASDGPAAVEWRRRLGSLMGDVSPFMKLLKQRFSIWYNKAHRRFGPLWSQRFTSVLIDPARAVTETIAAYNDLNPVRANLVADPKDYRFCGYGEAVAGHTAARAGLCSLSPGLSWQQRQAEYRQVLYGTGAAVRTRGRPIDLAAFQRVMKERGRLTLTEVLHCRIRHFTHGAVLGSRAFVLTHLEAYRRKTGRRERTAPRPLPDPGPLGALFTLRGLRRRATS